MSHSNQTTQNTPFSRLSSPTPSARTVLIHAAKVRRSTEPHESTFSSCGEELIVDDRATIGPAQMVEDKLARILKDSTLPVSHLLMRDLLRTR